MTLGDVRLSLFAAQTLLLGMASGLLVIVANTVFITEFGAQQLPWTYIASAIGAMVGTPMLARAVRRRTLAAIGVWVWGAYSLLTVSAFVALERFDVPWVSAPLLVMFPLGVIVGFFLVGGQAGRVFDLREMKERFPRIVIGFPVGFIVSGVLGDVLIGLLGGVLRLLPLVSATAIGLLVLMLTSRRRFPAELGSVVRTAENARPLPLRKLLENPFVALLVGYQMLSQLGTQLVEFLLFERAGARYTSADELGRFVSRLMSGVNIVDLVFLLFVAGYVMRRFGMKVGLALNPAVVTLLMVGAVIGGLGPGVASTLVFVLLIAARVFDIALNDGATRTALNTAYQAVPAEDRLAVQATTEVLGVPLALGVTGVILLVLQQGLGVGPLGISILTVIVGVLWVLAGWLVFRGYRTNLRRGLELRVIAPSDLDLDDPSTVGVIDRMLAGEDEGLVWLALSSLGDHPEMLDRLEHLALSGRREIADAAFEQLRALDEPRAEDVARRLQADPLSPLRLDALGYLAGRRPESAADSAAEITRALDSEDGSTRSAARRAAVLTGDPELLGRVVDDVVVSRDVAAAVSALALAGENLASQLEGVLELASDEGQDFEVVRAIRMLRSVRASSGETREVLLRHAQHRDRAVALGVRRALSRVGDVDGRVDRDSLLTRDVAFAARVLAALDVLPRDDTVAVLRRSLRDELALARELVLAILALAGDADLIRDAARKLAAGDDRAIAHAVETVEVHLSPGTARLVTPILDDRLTDAERLAQLRRSTDVPGFDLSGALRDMSDDPEDAWRSPWLAACAIHAAVVLDLAPPVGERWAARPDVAEIRAWVRRREASSRSDPDLDPAAPV
ncbi:MAG TPA: hypothetical protein VLB67_09295 [Acidimicrobiia bacterium]|nr:hypothetical protein [Acidimicrobiia bacterium]